MDIDNDGGIHRCHPHECHPSIRIVHGYKVAKSAVAVGVGLRNVRRAQKNTNNEILEVICERYLFDGVAHLYAAELLQLASDILTRMNHFGAAVSYRLRGDTVDHLFGAYLKASV